MSLILVVMIQFPVIAGSRMHEELDSMVNVVVVVGEDLGMTKEALERSTHPETIIEAHGEI